MKTVQETYDYLNRNGWPCSYSGENGDWLEVLGQHRDSDVLERCNFETAAKLLDDEDVPYEIERAGHWAVGWVETLIVPPEHREAAERICARLEEHPVLDEMALSDAEFDEAAESWEIYGRRDYHRELMDSLPPRVAEYVDDFETEEIDDLAAEARQVVNWEYQFDGGGCVFNTEGLAEATDRSEIARIIKEQRAGRVIRPVYPASLPLPCRGQLEMFGA